MADSESKSYETSRLVPVSLDPVCSESPDGSRGSFITPIDRFFVRSHFSSTPEIHNNSWSLHVDGEVEHPSDFNYADIKNFDIKTIVSTLECAGNSRTFISPPAEGIPFRDGALSTGKWSGVSVSDILKQVKVKDNARNVVFEGADYGEEVEKDIPIQLNYARSIPIEKAMDSDTIVAYMMNDEPLPINHGGPARIIVPGWYAMASVKWVVKISVIDHDFEGFFQKLRYTFANDGDDISPNSYVNTLRVKSRIIWPSVGEELPVGSYIIKGLAWSGDGDITAVEVSTDWGKTWKAADILASQGRYAWREWRSEWVVEKPGRTILMSRAIDSRGNVQPLNPHWNYRGYANNAVLPVYVYISDN